MKDSGYLSSKMHRTLVDNRHLFLSAKCRWTYSGYARAQANRIQLHKEYLLNPLDHAPTRFEFGLDEKRLISKDQLGALNALQKDDKLIIESDNFMEYLQKENNFAKAKQKWTQYLIWKENRNPVRAEMEAKFGYDLKHAMHLVRLYKQGIEILNTGFIKTFRDDREELLAIRNGAWTYDQLMSWMEQQDHKIEEAYNNTILPREPNRNLLNKLCISLIETSF